MKVLPLLMLVLVACGNSPTNAPVDPLLPSKVDLAIQDRLAGNTLRWASERQSFTWILGDGTYTFADSLGGKLRNSFGGEWWVRDPRFFIENSSGISLLSLEIRGESLYGEIEVVLGGFRYRVE